jgi:hypothetical protein
MSYASLCFLKSTETRLKIFFGLPEIEPLFHYFPARSVVTMSTEPTQLIHNIKWEAEVLKFLTAQLFTLLLHPLGPNILICSVISQGSGVTE